MKEFPFYSTCELRNGNPLKSLVGEILVKWIRVNHGVGVYQKLYVLFKCVRLHIFQFELIKSSYEANCMEGQNIDTGLKLSKMHLCALFWSC